MPVTIPYPGSAIWDDDDLFAEELDLDLTTMENRLTTVSNGWNAAVIGLVNGLMDVCSRSYIETDGNHRPLLASGVHLFRGPHVRIYGDGGVVFSLVSSSPGIQRNNRESSHVSLGPQRRVFGNTVYGGQYEVILPGGFGSVLFGVAAYNAEPPHTWFQAEATSGETWSNLLWHTVVDFSLHKMTGQQVGQLGYSPYTEKQHKALIYDGLLPASLLTALNAG